MLPMEKWFVPCMLAAGANWKMTVVRILCKTELCQSNALFISPAFFILLFILNIPSQKASFSKLIKFQLINV